VHGQVVGDSEIIVAGAHLARAFRTAPGAPIDPRTDELGTLGGPRSYAKDVNDLGVVVGDANVDGDPIYHAFVYFDGEGMFDLNERIVNQLPDGWTLEQAEGINNKGQIVGQIRVLTDRGVATRAFLLTPVPEPSLVALPVAALIFAARTAGRSACTACRACPSASITPPAAV
jgi:probable HAF family extracellular repeat protein